MKNTILKQSAAVLLAMSLLCGTATAGYAAQEAVAATSAASADTDETKAHKTPPTNADGTQKTPPAPCTITFIRRERTRHARHHRLCPGQKTENARGHGYPAHDRQRQGVRFQHPPVRYRGAARARPLRGHRPARHRVSQPRRARGRVHRPEPRGREDHPACGRADSST